VLPPAVIVIEVGLVLIVGMTIITDKITPTIDRMATTTTAIDFLLILFFLKPS
jgi:uncharacterized protein YoxC